MRFNNKKIEEKFIEVENITEGNIGINAQKLCRDLNVTQIALLNNIINGAYLKGLKDADDLIEVGDVNSITLKVDKKNYENYFKNNINNDYCIVEVDDCGEYYWVRVQKMD